MIPRACRRLAEVDFPIAAVSRHAAREKSIRHGHPSTLHLWWARRPLASSRAVLLALLLPDPADENCPADFREQARELLAGTPWNPARGDVGLRRALLAFIADFANWDNAAKALFLDTGRGLVKAAYPGDDAPLVVDPFAGGGSIPLEALRLGCEAFASDLNPVACLILKVMLEDIPRRGPELAEQLRRAGGEIKRQAEAELAGLYPTDPDGAKPIAYLWARTVRCESPNCGAEIPLLSSLWLRKKGARKQALRTSIVRRRGGGGLPSVAFEYFEPNHAGGGAAGPVARARGPGFFSGPVLPPARVGGKFSPQPGGREVVFYRLPTPTDYAAVKESQRQLQALLDAWERDGQPGLCPVPDEPLPKERKRGNSGFRVLLYGMKTWGDLFTARQKVALVKLVERIQKNDGPLRGFLAVALDRVADGSASLSRWLASGEEVKNVFGRQAPPMVWDFGEANYCAAASRTWSSAITSVANVVGKMSSTTAGQVQSADATNHPLPDETADVWFTDPPYYDAIAYADLADFFLVWLKRTLPGHPLLRDFFDPANPLSPKAREAVQDRFRKCDGRIKDSAFFEDAMAKAFTEGCRVLDSDGVGAVVFAHKTTEGWEALLSGLIDGGWTITGSWPLATEMANKVGAANKAILLTSVHLICRPRDVGAGVGDWADVLRELPGRVGDWFERLQAEGVHGADLVFACIGPALEIFSRHRAVEKPDGGVVGLTEYLERVWEVVGRTALGNILGGRARAAVVRRGRRLGGRGMAGARPVGEPPNRAVPGVGSAPPAPRPQARADGRGATAIQAGHHAGPRARRHAVPSQRPRRGLAQPD